MAGILRVDDKITIVSTVRKLVRLHFQGSLALFIIINLSAQICFARNLDSKYIGTASQSINLVFEMNKTKRIVVGEDIHFLDIIKTKIESFAELSFNDGSILTVGPESELVLDEFIYDPDKSTVEGTITLITGFFNFLGSKKSKTLKFKYKGSILGVRGTDLSMFATQDDQLFISIYKGEGILADRAGNLYAVPQGTGLSIESQSGKPLSNPKIVDFINERNTSFRKNDKLKSFKIRQVAETKEWQARYILDTKDYKIKVLGKFKEGLVGNDKKTTLKIKLDLMNKILKEKRVRLAEPFDGKTQIVKGVIFEKKVPKEPIQGDEGPNNKADNDVKKKINFSEKFKEERKKQGAGGSFVYDGKLYSTDLASDKKKSQQSQKTPPEDTKNPELSKKSRTNVHENRGAGSFKRPKDKPEPTSNPKEPSIPNKKPAKK